jgi:hypothetical protein
VLPRRTKHVVTLFSEIAAGALDLASTPARCLRCLCCGLGAPPEVWTALRLGTVVLG